MRFPVWYAYGMTEKYTPNYLEGARDELSLQRAAINFMRREDASEMMKEDPVKVLESLVQAMPDKPLVISREKAMEFVGNITTRNGTRSVFDHGEPVLLEGYLLAKVIQASPSVLQFDEIEPFQGHQMTPSESVHCLRDQVRTKKFLQAVEHAVQTIKSQQPDKQIRLCDAGSGAFPIQAIYAAMQDDLICCDCIESNQQSVEIAKALIKSFGLEDRVFVFNADARQCELQQSYDIIVSETMDTGLLSEPMSEIFTYLKTYSNDQTILIPSAVSVEAAVVDEEKYAMAERYTLIDADLAPIVEVEWTSTGSFLVDQTPSNIQLDIVNNTDGVKKVLLSSTVYFHNGTSLDVYDSRITSPLAVPSKNDPFIQRNKTMQVTYTPGNSIHDVATQIY